MLAKKVIVSSVLAAALFAMPRTGRSETLDSGIFGVVPHQSDLVHYQQREVDDLRKELAVRPDPDHRVRQALDEKRGVLSEMQNRCVEVFDPKSELPAVYPPPTNYKDAIATSSCVDRIRFPHGFMKMIAAAPCADDGSFRLALTPGRYAVFVGLTPWAPVYGLGPSSWWQYVDVPRRGWLHLALPTRAYAATCTSDADCQGPSQCLEVPSGQGSKITKHRCLSRRPSPPPDYNSGIRGRIGVPFSSCNQNGREIPPPWDYQCIEAFREENSEIVACAACRFDDGEYRLPLLPGRYVLEISRVSRGHNAIESGQESRAVEVAAGRWNELYLDGAKSGPVEFPTCPKVP
jgi:hypothetical protein